jgi:hypothetical protein
VERLSRRPTLIRILTSLALLSAWLVLLLWGSPLGAAVYLLLAGALFVFPWRLLRFDDDESA